MYKAGMPYNLLLACKGFDERPLAVPLDRFALEAEERQLVSYPDTGYDIGTYRRAAEDVKTNYVCFLNSFSQPQQQGWLQKLVWALGLPDVGIAGATSSLEGIPGCPFPNPHVRTNAFCMRRATFLDLDIPMPQEKADANQLEAGPNSLTRQVLKRGLRAVVVNSAGEIFNAERGEARHADTFRWGLQQRLLVSDNRTRDYANTSQPAKEYLQRLAWGCLEESAQP
jgi:hypothetical protein